MLGKQKGFSLVELMVVVAILLLLGAVSIPTLVTTYPTYKLKKSARDVCSNMRKARSIAVKQQRDVIIRFDTSQNSYSIDDGPPIALDAEITYGYGNASATPDGAGSLPSDGVGFTDKSVTFNSRGLSNANSQFVYLQNTKNQTFAIGATTAGSVSLRKWAGSWQ
jgi:prepilin-type N-terminal cleavage/methylation domain-containing protein